MSDRFRPLSMDHISEWIFGELKSTESIFGIPRRYFFTPQKTDRFRTEVYGHPLETPFGVAAGPHSQLCQNIIVAWLCGARFIELKTIQTLDELEIAKPCIDMRDEGYNVEWSQELKVHQSYDEYLKAWVLIHALHHHFGFPGSDPGVVFNMSVGYDLAGIKESNVQGFLKEMTDGGDLLHEYAELVTKRAPKLKGFHVPNRLSDNVTVSTMHGCPPEEIGKICHYLMDHWRLHTNVKLNPTLLGPEKVRSILNDTLGFRHITVPDLAFEHDLKYPDALELVNDLETASRSLGVRFGVKLCNTLEVVNDGSTFDTSAGEMMYLSGRPHHALAVNVAHRLVEDLPQGENLLLSFAGGADAWNVLHLLCSGMRTVTTCSDILKPGGYGRLLQYIENTRKALVASNARDMDELIAKHEQLLPSPTPGIERPKRPYLSWYASEVLKDRRLQRETYNRRRTQTKRELRAFDCIKAPCTDTCPISQQVPHYISHIADGDPVAAATVIREDNAMAAILGRACNHDCELTCVRAHYDEPVAIRELKRYAMAHESPTALVQGEKKKQKIAVVGGGPCGLSVAYFLGRAGYEIIVYEADHQLGGMVSRSIPAYRAAQSVLDQDLAFLRQEGLTVQLETVIGRDLLLTELHHSRTLDAIVLAAGAQKSQPLDIPGIEGEGFLDGLDFLQAVRRGDAPQLTKGPVGVVGGGDVAMDCARTAARLAPGRVSVIYRRTQEQMPAQPEELEGLLEEGIEICELLAPVAVLRDDKGSIRALECQPMKLGDPDNSGRRRPIPADHETVEVELRTLIVAIGQAPDLSFLGSLDLALSEKGYIAVNSSTRETSEPGIYAGGDLIENGPETIVKALGDGKAIATAIRERFEGPLPSQSVTPAEFDEVELIGKRIHRVERIEIPRIPERNTGGFDEIIGTLNDEAAKAEAARCLRCDLMCSLCVSVCPNRAFFTYRTPRLEARLPELTYKDGRLETRGHRPFLVEQSHQVAVIADFCNECGNCACFCPTAGAPYRDKPRLYLSATDFEAEEDNAFRLQNTQGHWRVLARARGVTHELELGHLLRYRTPELELTFDAKSFSQVEAKLDRAPQAGGPFSLELCATMLALLRGLHASHPFLPWS